MAGQHSHQERSQERGRLAREGEEAVELVFLIPGDESAQERPAGGLLGPAQMPTRLQAPQNMPRLGVRMATTAAMMSP